MYRTITHFFVPIKEKKIIAATQKGENFINSITLEYLEFGEIFEKKDLKLLFEQIKN